MTNTATIDVCPAAELRPGDSRLLEVEGRRIGVFNGRDDVDRLVEALEAAKRVFGT